MVKRSGLDRLILRYMRKTVNEKTEELHNLFHEGMAQSYQWKTRKKKTSEPCWMTDWLRNMIEDRRRMFRTAGFRTVSWKTFKKKIAKIV